MNSNKMSLRCDGEPQHDGSVFGVNPYSLKTLTVKVLFLKTLRGYPHTNVHDFKTLINLAERGVLPQAVPGLGLGFEKRDHKQHPEQQVSACKRQIGSMQAALQIERG